MKDGKVTFYPIEDSYYQFLQYMNKLYREGLIDPNSFVQEEVDIQAKGKEGKVGTLWVGSYIDIMVGDRGDEYEYFLPLENAEGKRTYVPNKFSRRRQPQPVYRNEKLRIPRRYGTAVRLPQQFL